MLQYARMHHLETFLHSTRHTHTTQRVHAQIHIRAHACLHAAARASLCYCYVAKEGYTMDASSLPPGLAICPLRCDTAALRSSAGAVAAGPAYLC